MSGRPRDRIVASGNPWRSGQVLPKEVGGLHEAAVRVRRVYEAPSPEDGARVLVDRLWPRGLSKDDARLDSWVKDVAPSDELRRWYGHDPARATEFADRYRAELEDEQRARALEELMGLLTEGSVTLLTATKDVERSHAVVLAEKLRELLAEQE